MSDEYEVGYKRPPAQHRFKKGQSGNPTGKCKKKKPSKQPALLLLADMGDEFGRQVKVKAGGQTRRMRMSRIMSRSICERAAKGDVAAARTALTIVRDVTPLAELFVDPDEAFKVPTLADFYKTFSVDSEAASDEKCSGDEE